jgi:hypothetical protein
MLIRACDSVFGFEFQTAGIKTVIASDSEAIHRAASKVRVDCFRLRSLSYGGRGRRFTPLRKRFAFVAGNDGGTHLRDLAARFARGLR